MLFSEIKTNVENTKQLEKELTEERSRYQDLLGEYLNLEERNRDLTEEMEPPMVRMTSLSPPIVATVRGH